MALSARGCSPHCVCQPSWHWRELGREGCGRDCWQGKGWTEGEGRSAPLGTSPLCWLASPRPRTPAAWSRRGRGFSLRYQRCNHLGLQVFLGLTLTHIYTTEVLFCMPSTFLLCVLFFLKKDFNIKPGASHPQTSWCLAGLDPRARKVAKVGQGSRARPAVGSLHGALQLKSCFHL